MKPIDRSLAKFSSDLFLGKVCEKVDTEVSLRQVRRSRCTVIEVPKKKKLSFVPDGCVIAIIGLKGNNSLKRIEDAIRTDDLRLIKDVENEINTNYNKFKELIETAIQQETILSSEKIKVPNVAEIRYAGKTLVNYCIVTNDLPLNLQLFPYNGGMLKADQFALIEYFDNNSSEELDCVLLVNKPDLSEIEEKALNLLPLSSTALNIGTAFRTFTPLVLQAATHNFVIDLEKTMIYPQVLIGGTKGFILKDIGIIENNKAIQLIENIPSEATAKELLLLRKKLLELQIS